MANDYRSDDCVTKDPIAIEPVLAVLSIVVHILSFSREFAVLSTKNRRIRQNFRRLREEVLRLNNAIDDVILTVGRHAHYANLDIGEGPPVTNRRPTVSDTLIELREGDYARWRDTRDRIHELGESVYRVMSDTRKAVQEVDNEPLVQSLDADVFSKVDEVIIGFGSSTFGDVVAKLRQVLSELDKMLKHVYEHPR
jgi:hypothetical protein